MSEGNEQVILCERGIRTFETYTRNTGFKLGTIGKKTESFAGNSRSSHATGPHGWLSNDKSGGSCRCGWRDGGGSQQSRDGVMRRFAVNNP